MTAIEHPDEAAPSTAPANGQSSGITFNRQHWNTYMRSVMDDRRWERSRTEAVPLPGKTYTAGELRYLRALAKERAECK